MKKRKKLITLALVVTMIMMQIFVGSGYSAEAASGKWKKDSKGYYYEYSKGNYAKNEWVKSSGKYYYLDGKGYMVTGWQEIDGKWYYFSRAGIMQTGWQKLSGKWFYFSKYGTMMTGWQKISGNWYYFSNAGIMQTGWKKISGKWYYFNAGVMTTGWLDIGDDTYAFKDDGTLYTGRILITDNYIYAFDKNNKMVVESEHNNDLAFVIDSVKYDSKKNLIVTGYYVNASSTTYAKSFNTLDFAIYDANGELVASIRYSNYTYLNLKPGYYATDRQTFTVKKSLLEKTNADLSDYSFGCEFGGVTH